MSIRAAAPCNNGETRCLNDETILGAINQILEYKRNGAPIVAVNMSYSGEYPVDYRTPEYNAMKKLEENGIISVAAAGNDGVNLNTINTFPAEYDLRSIVTVAAVQNDRRLAHYSNYGNIVGIAAPGGGWIYSPEILRLGHSSPYSYVPMSGTSMAAPFISGLLGAGVALYNKDKASADYPGIAPAQLINILYDSASAGSFGGNVEGNRLVDVDAFFQKIEDCREEAKSGGGSCSVSNTYPPRNGGAAPSDTTYTPYPSESIEYDPASDPCSKNSHSLDSADSHGFGGCSIAPGDKGGISGLLLFLAIPLLVVLRRRIAE
jgi:subtilisin family serine protease